MQKTLLFAKFLLSTKGAIMTPEKTQLKIYSDRKNIKHSNKIINQIKITSNANVIELGNPTVVVDTKTIAYGVFDKNGKFVKQSLQYRGKTHQFIPHKVPSTPEYINATAILVGNIYPHFGHFLVEQINRLYGAIGKPRDIKYVFIDNRGIGAQNFVYEFMSAFGVEKENIVILNKSTRFKKLYIPKQTLNISGAQIDENMPRGYREMANNIHGAGFDKVYMSRDKLPESMRTLGEQKVQEIFRKNGYKIIYPEQMSITEQIAAVRDAKYLAGCAGTALHWALFMKPGGTVITLKRNQKRDIFVQTQYMFNTVCGLKSVFIWASTETHKSNHGGKHPPQIIGVNKHLLEFFDDFGFKYSKSDIAPDKNAIKAYNEQYEQYTAENGSSTYIRFCKTFVKIISCFIPGRINRNHARRWLKTKLHI